MIAKKTTNISNEKPLSDFDKFIKKFNLEGSVSSESTSSKVVKDTSVGNCCGTCEFCPLA